MISVIIVNYKNEKLTVSYVKNEISKMSGIHSVIIVNNQATPESDDYLRSSLNAEVVYDINTVVPLNSFIYIIHNDENVGFAQGNNKGAEFVVKKFPQVHFFLFTNNDIVVNDSNVLDYLVNKLDNNNQIGIIGPNVIGTDGFSQSPEQRLSFIKFFFHSFIQGPLGALITRDKPSFPESACEGFCYKVMGSFFMCRRDDYMECGMMDPNTFLYFEENILTERMKAIGKQTYFAPGCTVLHNHGTTIGQYTSKVRQRDIYYNSAAYYYHHYRGTSLFIIVIGRVVLQIINLLSLIHRGGRYVK